MIECAPQHTRRWAAYRVSIQTTTNKRIIFRRNKTPDQICDPEIVLCLQDRETVGSTNKSPPIVALYLFLDDIFYRRALNTTSHHPHEKVEDLESFRAENH